MRIRFSFLLKFINIFLILLLAFSLFFYPAISHAEQTWVWPLEGKIITPFNFDISNYYSSGQHTGVDIKAVEETEVVAPIDGKVYWVAKNPFGRGGVGISIDHESDISTTYFGLKEARIKKGDVVKQGDVIAIAGPEGDKASSDAPHLHFGVFRTSSRPKSKTEYLNPLDFLPPLYLEENNPEQATELVLETEAIPEPVAIPEAETIPEIEAPPEPILAPETVAIPEIIPNPETINTPETIINPITVVDPETTTILESTTISEESPEIPPELIVVPELSPQPSLIEELSSNEILGDSEFDVKSVDVTIHVKPRLTNLPANAQHHRLRQAGPDTGGQASEQVHTREVFADRGQIIATNLVNETQPLDKKSKTEMIKSKIDPSTKLRINGEQSRTINNHNKKLNQFYIPIIALISIIFLRKSQLIFSLASKFYIKGDTILNFLLVQQQNIILFNGKIG